VWGQGKYKKLIPFNTASNVPIMYSASSSLAYCTYTTTFEVLEASFFRRKHVLQFPGLCRRNNLTEQEFVAKENINYKKGKSISETAMNNNNNKMITTSDKSLPAEKGTEEESNISIHMNALTFDPTPPLEEDKEFYLAAAADQAELMQWHYRLGHLSFPKLKLLAKNGEIPRRLAKIPPPKCTGCLFGAMTKLPWHGKESKSSHKVFTATKPGENISVDHMISTQVGFFAQLKGKLTSKRYRAASIFVDQFSCLRYVHLMQDLLSDKPIKAKEAFKQFAAKHGITIKHYYCNNGQFADNAFQQACQQNKQQLTFCGVNAHVQNGIAERAIRDLSESAQRQLLHARQ
jgi:hypothetical protein